MNSIHSDSNSEFERFVEAIKKSPPVSREREKELFKRLHAGDEKAWHEILNTNLLFVVRVANEFRNRGLPISELISEGCLGLAEAACGFNEEFGTKFITFAVRQIRRVINKALKEKARLVRLRENGNALLASIYSTEQELIESNCAYPRTEQIARKLNRPIQDLLYVLDADTTPTSLTPVEIETGDPDPFNLIPDNSHNPSDILFAGIDSQFIKQALRELDNREFAIVRLYYGLDGCLPLTLEKIGDLMSLTHEGCRQIRNQALDKLRNSPYILEFAGKDGPIVPPKNKTIHRNR